MSRAAKGADCKSAGLAFVGSSPTSPTIIGIDRHSETRGSWTGLFSLGRVVIIGAALRPQCLIPSAPACDAGLVSKVTNIPGAMPHIDGM